jgi:hypothetical protein
MPHCAPPAMPVARCPAAPIAHRPSRGERPLARWRLATDATTAISLVALNMHCARRRPAGKWEGEGHVGAGCVS